MTDKLPPVVNFRQNCCHGNGWSDHYGAMHVAAAYAGLELPEPNIVRGIWHHGCFAPWQDGSPGLLSFNLPNARQLPLRVARQEQVDLLVRAGYEDVQAIGLPIVYTAASNVARVDGTLLVVPTHTLVGDKFPDRSQFERYADEIKALAGPFRRVVACIHPNCRRNNLWLKEFSERGIEIVIGAQTNDRNALLRIRMLLEQFEFVTTNGWGSHVAYALALGAKVSIHGSQPHRSAEDCLKDTTWAADPEALKHELSGETEERKREFLRRYHVAPQEGVTDVATGRWLIGADHQVSPAAMKEILEEMVEGRSESEVLAAKRRELCRQTRANAAQLAAAGRLAEAVQLLLRFVQLAADTKNPRFILETLQEISAELRPLDPVRAGRLQEQARLLAARIETLRQTAA